MLYRLFSTFASIILAISALPAQWITRSVEGIIFDPSGNAIAAAVLRMVADSTGAERSQSAAADGCV